MGSTTAAIITLLNTVISLLSSEPYVIVILLDFLRPLILYVMDPFSINSHRWTFLTIYNWLANFFCDHFHCTLFHDQLSSLLDITASIIQGSTIRPATYVVTAGDLTTCISENFLRKYADDTNLSIPASNESSRHIEFVNIQNWAKQNNLKLNCDKACEIVFTDSRRRRPHAPELPLMPGIVHCRSLKMLGMVIADDFSVTQHVQ